MKILIDTNIILDHLLDRTPFNQAAEWIFVATENGHLESFIGATTVTTTHYLLSKSLGAKAAHFHIEKLLRLFEIAPITRTVLASAILHQAIDFEDSVLCEAALHVGAEAIITRDPKGFQHIKMPIYSSDEFVIAFDSLKEKTS